MAFILHTYSQACDMGWVIKVILGSGTRIFSLWIGITATGITFIKKYVTSGIKCFGQTTCRFLRDQHQKRIWDHIDHNFGKKMGSWAKNIPCHNPNIVLSLILSRHYQTLSMLAVFSLIIEAWASRSKTVRMAFLEYVSWGLNNSSTNLLLNIVPTISCITED